MRRTMRQRRTRIIAALCAGLGVATWVNAQPRLTWLGTLGGSQSAASDVSDDGSVVVGWSYDDTWQGDFGFRWTASEGMRPVPTTGFNQARGVSADGSVLVGWANDNFNPSWAWRWTTASPSAYPLRSWSDSSEAYAVSADGTVVAGTQSPGFLEPYHAFRWTASTGMRDLGTLGGRGSEAHGISADGSTVVGTAQIAGNLAVHPFRWTEAGGMQDLGTLGGQGGVAICASADGSVVAGRADDAAGLNHAFRWTESGGMQDLGTLNGVDTWATAVSADGSIVLGATADFRAFRWTPQGGMEDLNVAYASLLTNGSTLMAAGSITPNGRFIVGHGHNGATGRTEAFLLDTIPGPGSLAALGAGLAGLAVRRRRERHAE